MRKLKFTLMVASAVVFCSTISTFETSLPVDNNASNSLQYLEVKLWQTNGEREVVKESLWKKDYEGKVVEKRLRKKEYERDWKTDWEWKNKREWLQRFRKSFLTLFPHSWQDKNKAGTRPIVAKQPLNVCVFVRVCVLVCFCSWVMSSFGLQIVFCNYLC